MEKINTFTHKVNDTSRDPTFETGKIVFTMVLYAKIVKIVIFFR